MPKKKFMSLDEYLTYKADSTRNAALEKSYTRGKGVKIPYEFGEGEKEKVKEILEAAMPYAARFTYGPFTSEQEKSEVKNANYFLGNYYQAKKELEDNCKYGFNCIATATDNYPKESRTVSNKDFDENFEKYGFRYVGMKNAKPGDIAKTSEHSMIYVGTDVNGNPLFNYSDGGITEYNYKKDAKYPAPYYGVYTYVGTPELIQQWTNEYNQKKLGGMKKVRQKKFIGAVIGTVGTIASSVIQSQQQKKLLEAQQKEQRIAQNQANLNTYLQNTNELINADNSWAYDKFKPAFRCGGKKRMKAELGKYKARFSK